MRLEHPCSRLVGRRGDRADIASDGWHGARVGGKTVCSPRGYRHVRHKGSLEPAASAQATPSRGKSPDSDGQRWRRGWEGRRARNPPRDVPDLPTEQTPGPLKPGWTLQATVCLGTGWWLAHRFAAGGNTAVLILAREDRVPCFVNVAPRIAPQIQPDGDSVSFLPKMLMAWWIKIQCVPSNLSSSPGTLFTPPRLSEP